MIVRGIVIDCNDSFVIVKCSKNEACGSCPSKQKCVSKSVPLFFSDDNCQLLKISNIQRLCLVKQQVVGLEIPDSFIYKSTVAIYFVPIFVSIVISIILDNLFNNEMLTILSFVLCVLVQPRLFMAHVTRNIKIVAY
jgi:positive regulator of sigma E activity